MKEQPDSHDKHLVTCSRTSHHNINYDDDDDDLLFPVGQERLHNVLAGILVCTVDPERRLKVFNGPAVRAVVGKPVRQNQG